MLAHEILNLQDRINRIDELFLYVCLNRLRKSLVISGHSFFMTVQQCSSKIYRAVSKFTAFVFLPAGRDLTEYQISFGQVQNSFFLSGSFGPVLSLVISSYRAGVYSIIGAF